MKLFFSYLEGLESPCTPQVQVPLRFLPVRLGQLLLEYLGIHRLLEFLKGQIFLEFPVHLVDRENPSDHLRHFPQILQALLGILPVLKRMFKMALLIYYIYRVHREALFVHLGLSGRSTCDFCQFEHHSSCKPAVPESLAPLCIASDTFPGSRPNVSPVDPRERPSQTFRNLKISSIVLVIDKYSRTMRLSLFEISEGSFLFIVLGKIGRTSMLFS